MTGTMPEPNLYRSGRAAVSYSRQDLVAHKMKSDHRRMRAIKIEGRNRVLDIPAKLIPRVGLCEDALIQAFRNKSAIRFLCNLKHYFTHAYHVLHYHCQ